MKLKVTIDQNLREYDKKESKKKIIEVRLNKYLSESGMFSRREADKLIEKGLLHINDRVANLGDKVRDGDSIFINQKEVAKKYYTYYKPRGEETKFKMFNGERYDPVGRLDKESEGLLIYTNDFRLVDGLLNPENKFEREYLIKTKEKSTPRVKTILERGIETQEAVYAPVKKVIMNDENRTILHITLTEGKKHEIRRMLNALNLTIISLKRIRFEFLRLGSMKEGQMKELTTAELEKLMRMLKLDQE